MSTTAVPTMRETSYRIVYPEGRVGAVSLPPGGAFSNVMRPLAFLYGQGARAVRSARESGRKPLEIGSVVVSIGNLELGGNGKTPFAIHLVNELRRRGRRPVYVSRGFRSAAEAMGVVTVVAPKSVEPLSSVGPGVRILLEDAGALHVSVGDEGAMVAARSPGVPLFFCRDKRRAVEAAWAMFRPTHVILDDAFQSWVVPRDVDIVLLDAETPLGNGRLLPAGTLREGAGALERAHAIGFNGLEGEDRLDPLARWVLGVAGRAVPVFGVRRRLSFIEAPSGDPVSPPQGPVAAVSSVGRPRRFEMSLLGCGVGIGLALRYPDHFRYREADVRGIGRMVAAGGLAGLVTTEKDWVKLRDFEPFRARAWVARLELTIVGADPVQECEKPQAAPAASL